MSRPRCYDTEFYQWSFQHIPLEVPGPDGPRANPVRDAAVFVVHGMGEQAYGETAVQFRDGFEDVLEELGRIGGADGVPPPLILDGYWANYDDFQATFSEEWATFREGERTFFKRLWERRSRSVWRPAAWISWQALRLVFDRKVRAETSLPRRISYLWIALLSWAGVLYMLLRHRRVLANVLDDVRLYADPRGVVQRTIVQRIERTVGERFLLLLGIDWDFRTLDVERQLRIAGQPHRFRYVTWVAHSLGSVVSYNVISDLLTRCAEKRQLLANPAAILSRHERQELEENLARVETGLHRFITIGSPLQKFAFLFPSVLRIWPSWFLQRRQADTRHWWVNFFHIWDPVSGRLLDKAFFPPVDNRHSRRWSVPLLAHTSYWRDGPVLTHILSRAYGRELLPAALAPAAFLAPASIGWLRAMSLVLLVPIAVGIVFALGYGLLWALRHPFTIWETIRGLLAS